MGKLKRAKKFRKSHLSDKVQQKKKEQKHAKLVQKRTKRSSAAGTEEPEQNGFDAPDQGLALAKDDDEQGGFEQYLSDSGEDSEPQGEASEGSDDERAAAEEAAYLNGNDSEDELVNEPEDGISLQMVQQWAKELEASFKPVKKIIRALRTEDSITDTATFDALLKLGLVAVPKALRENLPLTENKLPKQTKRFTEYTPVIKVYCQVLAGLLRGRSDKRIVKVLAATRKTFPYFVSMRKDLKELIKSLVHVVVNADLDGQTRVQTFSVMREVCLKYPNSVLELFLKYDYEALLRLCNRTSQHTLPVIAFAKNVLALLYIADSSIGYQTAFQQIRTLALNLKSALDKQKNPDMAQKVIYTWQYVQSLDFFTRVLSVAADADPNGPMQQLLHPLVQVMLRVATLIPSAAYFPLRFNVVRNLARLSQHTKAYIPLAPILVDVLTSTALSRKAKKSSLQQFDFDANLRVSANYLDTQVYQNGLCEELADLFAEVLVVHTKSIAFPELAGPVVVTLRRSAKRTSNPRLSKSLQQVIERINANIAFVLKHRQAVTFAPSDKEEVDAFLSNVDWAGTPLGGYVQTRRKVKEERARLLAEQDDEEDEDDASSGLSGLEDDALSGDNDDELSNSEPDQEELIQNDSSSESEGSGEGEDEVDVEMEEA